MRKLRLEDTAGEQRGHDVNLVRPVLKPLYLLVITTQFCLYLENNHGTREGQGPHFLGYVLGWAFYVKKNLVLQFPAKLVGKETRWCFYHMLIGLICNNLRPFLRLLSSMRWQSERREREEGGRKAKQKRDRRRLLSFLSHWYLSNCVPRLLLFLFLD